MGCPPNPTERPIKAGEEVLHTYGDLSDAQLLLTYGFVEQLPTPNPHNYALLPYRLLIDGAARTLGAAEAPAVVGGRLLEAKEKLLQRAGLLQAAAAAARETEFVATSEEPLSDELLTTVQVRPGWLAVGLQSGSRWGFRCPWASNLVSKPIDVVQSIPHRSS